jgi:hypothetical protein
VNLTRFSLFFPEKRDFFLENQGSSPSATIRPEGATTRVDVPLLFYSRRIGLRTIARFRSGRAAASPGGSGATSLASIDMQTRRTRGIGTVDQFLGAQGEARHPAAQQHRRARDVAIRIHVAPGSNQAYGWTAPSPSSRT